MQHRLLVKSLLLFLITTCFALALRTSEPDQYRSHKNAKSPSVYGQEARERRAIGYKKSKPGFFKTLFSVVYEQWSDTRKTFNDIGTMLNNNFLPENAPVTEATTMSSDPNVTTVKTPYRITRTEFGKIVRRNLRGLVRLFNIELKDALKYTDSTKAQFRKNASLEVSKFL